MTAPNVAPGSVIAGRFSVRALLGYGGTTATFRAVTAQARDVALKLYSPLIGQRPEAMQHLQRCVAETNALPPDLAAHILEAGYDPATAAPFTITDFVQSASLAQVVMRRPMGAEEVAAMLRTLAAVLDAAHARELFHHGLKPTNVFVDPAAPGNVKVTDFGPALARVMLPTPEGYVLAAPWIAPEQVQSGVQPRAAADIFSAALLAFAALTGRSYWRSCQGPVDVSSWQRELMGPRAPASARAAELGIPLSPALDGIFARALSHDPNDRFRSATELAAALSGFATTRMDVGTTLALAPSINEAAGLPPQGLTGTVAVPAIALPPLPTQRAQLPVETQIAPAPAYFSQGAPAGSPAPSAAAAPSPAAAAATPATPAPGGASSAEPLSAIPPPGSPSPAVSVPSASAAAAGSSPAHVSPAAPTVASGGAIPSRSPLGKAASIAVGIAAVLLVGGAAAAWFALSGKEETPSPTAPGDVGSASASAPVASAPPEVPTSAPAASAPPPSPDAGAPDDAGASEDAASASADAPVKITCKPVDCEEIAVDGKPVDLGSELRLSPGPHRISVKRAGYTPQIRTIIVKAGTPVEQAFELAAVPPSKPAPATNKPCGKFLKRCK